MIKKQPDSHSVLPPRISPESGFSLIESLISMLICAVILTGAVSAFSMLSKIAEDNKLKTIAQLQAQSVVETMAPELRMIGNGVPFHQSNFLIDQATLSDKTVTQPILVDATGTDQIQFRLNETGETYILTADFNPASASTVSLTGTSKMIVGDEIYITNSTVGDDDGMWGRITTINSASNTITLAAGSQYNPGSTFAKGSLLEVVPKITYTSTRNFGGITRDEGLDRLTLVNNGQFTLTYLNAEGTALSLPLQASSATPFPVNSIQNVHAIKVVVQVRSEHKLSNGQDYMATAIQTVGIRNLNYKY